MAVARFFSLAFVVGISTLASAQFVWPKPDQHQAEPGLYTEDPFIVEYRQKFFSVFRGDFATFNKAFDEIELLVKKNPKDARALVWLGNGQTIKAGFAFTKGQIAQGKSLHATSLQNLDLAVSLRPQDPNIYMMRAATLYVQGQFLPADWLDRKVWERLRNDCEKFIKYVGPSRMKRASVHLRGEAYGELGVAYARLGEKDKARKAFLKVIELNPGTNYSQKAEQEIAKLAAH